MDQDSGWAPAENVNLGLPHDGGGFRVQPQHYPCRRPGSKNVMSSKLVFLRVAETAET